MIAPNPVRPAATLQSAVARLVAPAGNLPKLQTAVDYGADAVYLAGESFGLRTGAENFNDFELALGVEKAHARDCKVYCVVNGFLFPEELDALDPFIEKLVDLNVDAVVVSDLGVLLKIRDLAPSLRLHVSTQASCLNAASATLWREAGASRIVAARELSIDEVASIQAEASIEMEMFIHGAMCMAYSGNCVISNYTAGRDSNRGGCKQSCRFEYTLTRSDGREVTRSFMSSTDLHTLQALPSAIEKRIPALKIEGRMRSPLYVAATLRAYRRVRDAVIQDAILDELTLAESLADLERFAHRPYASGNALAPAGRESIIEHDGRRSHDAGFVGQILDVDSQGRPLLHLRNPVTDLETLDVLGFDGRTITLSSDFEALNGQRTQVPRPNTVWRLPAHEDIQPGQVVTRSIT